MIRTIAEFLIALKNQESQRLNAIEMSHAPTIGEMYEGLSKELLSRAIPASLGLQIVSGFISDGERNLSGQIDCMLVRGQGEPIPYTDAHTWHIKDVIAVFEIKKNLYGADLADAFDHLSAVRQLEHNYFMSAAFATDERIDVGAAKKAFAETTRIIVSTDDDINSLSLQDRLIFHTLVLEQLGPVKIVLGYQGFKSEFNFRESLMKHIEGNIGIRGFGVGSFPQLIISGGFTLGKANGQPFSVPLVNGKWPFYFSCSANPLLLLLEYIWTRLGYEFAISGWWGTDLSIESLHSFLIASVQRSGEKIGWYYSYQGFNARDLAAARTFNDWEPVYLSEEQFVAINMLCQGRTLTLGDDGMLSYLESKGLDFDEFKDALLRTGLVGMSGNELQLITEKCQCVVLPNGDYVAAENNAGRLTRWVQDRAQQGWQ